MFRFLDGLMVSLSRTSGSRWWWLVSGLMVLCILAWAVMFLPWLDANAGFNIGVGSYSRGFEATFIVYGHELTPQAAEIYFKAVYVSIPFVALAIRIFDLAGYFASGYTYKVVRPGRFISGVWTRN